jgi:hypothetical protein
MNGCSALRRRLGTAMAGMVMLCVVAPAAFGAPVTYVFSGPATGTLGSTPFTNAQVTVTGTADTANIVQFDAVTPCVNLTGVTIAIAGIGTTTATGPNFLFDFQAGPGWGFENGTCTVVGQTWLGVNNGLAATYGLATSIGPTTGTQDFANSTPTAAGSLTFTSVPLTFQATLGQVAQIAPVPTLSQLALLALGLMLTALAAYVLRGRMPLKR